MTRRDSALISSGKSNSAFFSWLRTQSRYSLPWLVQVAECTRLFQGKKPCVASAKVRQKVRERLEAQVAKVGLS